MLIYPQVDDPLVVVAVLVIVVVDVGVALYPRGCDPTVSPLNNNCQDNFLIFQSVPHWSAG